jgi:hypothetical protein
MNTKHINETPMGTNSTQNTMKDPHPNPLPRWEREQETTLCAPAPLLPTWEKGLGDEGFSLCSLEFFSRVELTIVIDRNKYREIVIDVGAQGDAPTDFGHVLYLGGTIEHEFI